MAALITFKVDVDPKSGVPSKNLTNEAKAAEYQKHPHSTLPDQTVSNS